MANEKRGDYLAVSTSVSWLIWLFISPTYLLRQKTPRDLSRFERDHELSGRFPGSAKGVHQAHLTAVWRDTWIRCGLATMIARAFARDVATFSRCAFAVSATLCQRPGTRRALPFRGSRLA